MSFRHGLWVNEPDAWSLDAEVLTVTTDAGTDFWRETHYGFTRDTGHLFGVRTEGDFTAQLRVRAQYRDLYDQAGLMVRIDETRWIKAGIEFSDSVPMLSSVLTIGRSDWSTARYADDCSDFWLRVTLREGVLRLQVSADGATWPLVRLAPFPVAERYTVGPMCCTPERAGLCVTFSEFQVGPPLHKHLHDLS